MSPWLWAAIALVAIGAQVADLARRYGPVVLCGDLGIEGPGKVEP
jgi:hypothetical protein